MPSPVFSDSAIVLPVLAACLALLLYLVTTLRVGHARRLYGVKAPATTGHAAFERIFRVQQNTLEQLVLFLPALYLFTVTVSPLAAGIIGLVWVAGRAWYAWSYWQGAERRGLGYLIGLLASTVLLIGATIAALATLF